ncbi:MAG TPA: hypothetical protein VMY37_07010 [Thermoguttaceae bacterium]|nr:hypothetical protein [Thermoguttaceae bacterium]
MRNSPWSQENHERGVTVPTRAPVSSIHILVVAALILGSLAPVWATEFFPSQNGPWYLLAAHMMREYGNPQWNYAEYYELSWHPIPHMLHTLLMFGFSYLAPIFIAQKLALSVYVILLPLSIFYFLSVAAPDKKVLGYFAFLMIHSYTFYRGYHNFCLSIPLFFFTFAVWLRHRENLRKRDLAILAVLASLTYLSHLFAFLLLVFAIGWYQLIQTQSFRTALRSVFTVTWPAWLLLLYFVFLNLQVNTWVDRSEREWLLPHTAVEYFVRKFFYTTSASAYAVGVAGFLWIVYLLGRRFIQAIANGRHGLAQALRDPFLTMVLVLIPLYFLLPWKFWNWHYISARMIPFMLALSLAAAGSLPVWGRRVGFQAAFVATVALAALAIDGLMTCEVVRLEKYVQQYTSGIAAFEPNGKLLPIHVENPQFGQIRPLTRAHEYYHIARGGANGQGAAYFNTLVPVRYRAHPIERAFPGFEEDSAEQSMKRIAEAYDYVLVWAGDREWTERLQRSGFNLAHADGKLELYRNGRSQVSVSACCYPENQPGT